MFHSFSTHPEYISLQRSECTRGEMIVHWIKISIVSNISHLLSCCCPSLSFTPYVPQAPCLHKCWIVVVYYFSIFPEFIIPILGNYLGRKHICVKMYTRYKSTIVLPSIIEYHLCYHIRGKHSVWRHLWVLALKLDFIYSH